MAHNIALPQLPDGRTYITLQMMREHPEVADLYQRTRNSWDQDWVRDRMVMFPSIERKQRFVEVED